MAAVKMAAALAAAQWRVFGIGIGGCVSGKATTVTMAMVAQRRGVGENGVGGNGVRGVDGGAQATEGGGGTWRRNSGGGNCGGGSNGGGNGGNDSIDIEVSISMSIFFRFGIGIDIDDTFKAGIDIEYRRYF